jgi:hypothetical protein
LKYANELFYKCSKIVKDMKWSKFAFLVMAKKGI